MSRDVLKNIFYNAKAVESIRKASTISNLSVIAGVVIIIVFIIVYTFFI